MSCPNRPGLTFEPHPEDCSFYFICSNGESNLQFCSTGLIFDINTRRCALASVGTCVSGTTVAPETTAALTTTTAAPPPPTVA